MGRPAAPSANPAGPGRPRSAAPGRPASAAATALLVAACLAVGACASGGGDEPGRVDGATGDERLLVVVENDTDFQVRVQLVSDVQVASLGTVSALSADTLEVPGALTGTNRRYRLQADPVGSAACYQSDDVFAGSGDVIEWRLFGRPSATCLR